MRRARIEEMRGQNFSNDYSRKIHQGCRFDEECRRIRMSRVESKPFSDALEALNSDKEFLSGAEKFIRKSHTQRETFDSAAERSSSRVRISFSVGEIAKRLKHTFEAKKSRSIFGDDCIHRGVDAMNPSTSSTHNVRTKENQSNKRGLKVERESDTRRKKIDLSEKDGVDAVLAANRLVCNRLIMGRSPRRREMIISSLEQDCWPRRDSQCCSTSQRISTMDSVSDNDFPSTPPSIDRFNVPESSKYQEEHESPVSVLDQFFEQDHIHNSSIIIFQSDRGPLKPRRLCFEECSSNSISNQDYISQYIHLVFQNSSINWDQISTIRPISEELLHSSLYDEVGHLFSDSHLGTRLLFDRMNEVLLQIQLSHLLSATEKRRINHRSSLEEAVVDEIQRDAEFYQTQETTLDQIVAKDVADCRLWFDLMLETEHDIIIHISQHILEESIVDVMLDIHC